MKLSPFETLEPRRLMAVGPVIDKGAVRIETALGRITFLLTPEATPLTVANFIRYLDANRYDNTVIHRKVDNFVVQLGGFKQTSGVYSHIETFPPVPNEFEGAQAAATAAGSTKVNVRGTVAMAKVGSDPNSATSEFFINLGDNSANLDAQNGGFTTFARVIGAGMHVADTINNLEDISATTLNSAFTNLPVVKTSTGNNPIFVSDAIAQDVLPITLNKGTRFVSWIDENGGETTISLSGPGRADLTFIGGQDLQFTRQGNRVTVTGNNVTLEEVSTRQTTRASALAVKTFGGNGPSSIGSITLVNGALGRIDAGSTQLIGDITSAGPIGFIDLKGTYRSTISTKGGSLNLSIQTALTTSVKVDGGTLNSFRNAVWFDDGRLPTTISAKQINFLEINGNFSSNLTTTGDVKRVVINGNIGNLGGSTWTVGGSLKDVSVRKVMGLTANVSKTIGSFRASEIQPSFGKAKAFTRISANTIANLNATSLQMVTIDAAKVLQKLTVTGGVDSSVIRSDKKIQSVTIGGSFTGNTLGKTGEGKGRVQSVIYAGVDQDIVRGLITDADDFINRSASIGKVTIGERFANAVISAPIVGELNLRTLKTTNTKVPFGVTALKRINRLAATTESGKLIAMPAVTSQAQVEAYFSRAMITDADRGDFEVRVIGVAPSLKRR